MPDLTTLTGVGVSPGVGAGPVVRVVDSVPEPKQGPGTGTADEEFAAAAKALEDVATDLEDRGRRAGGEAQHVLEAQAMMARIYEEQVTSNRILVEIDPDLYQFLIGVRGAPRPLIAALEAMKGAARLLQSWAVLAQNGAAEATETVVQARGGANAKAGSIAKGGGIKLGVDPDTEVLRAP